VIKSYVAENASEPSETTMTHQVHKLQIGTSTLRLTIIEQPHAIEVTVKQNGGKIRPKHQRRFESWAASVFSKYGSDPRPVVLNYGGGKASVIWSNGTQTVAMTNAPELMAGGQGMPG
jgi:hypothetical protein